MAIGDVQKSEVHESTGDASSSPVGGSKKPNDKPPHAPSDIKAPVGPPVSGHTEIIRDDTDVGGPLVITSDDPDLNPPRVPIDPFPTDGTPEIDPPVERTKKK